MELVVWLERSIKTPEQTKIATNRMEEGKTVSMRTFYKAINMLKEMAEAQAVEHLLQAKKTR
eukprot:12797824-Heterocapsa_arctica.AAC.1